ncbi:substrate-binding domain-containing protein [Aeromicrobium sp. UC242_57]|uniref:substrate-binding domain-containing protein n=1 Tax=Aeromicrobium sp. UC242_57 TaxID=3374624 RepID=UPI003798C986
MIRQRVSFAVAGALVAGTALTVGLAGPASAAATAYDPNFTPASGDLVGVGSDTIEIALDYLAKGADGAAGFNAGTAGFKIASFAAAGDPATVTLRSGSAAIARSTINGSGSGKSKLYGTGNNADVNFARSSSTLSAAEISAGLQQYPFAVDGLKLAVSATVPSNAPETISPADLVRIYSGAVTNWSQLGGTPRCHQAVRPADDIGHVLVLHLTADGRQLRQRRDARGHRGDEPGARRDPHQERPERDRPVLDGTRQEPDQQHQAGEGLQGLPRGLQRGPPG